MKIKLSVLLLLVCNSLFAQTLKSFSANMRPDSLCYLSIKNAKAYTGSSAGEAKTLIDLGLFETRSGKPSAIEWYNLKPDNEKVPAALTGTTTKIAAISFDREQFDKCKTVADLKRMAGYITSNSLSHFAVVRNSDSYYQRCFIVEREDGKRCLIFVTNTGTNAFKIEVKAE